MHLIDVTKHFEKPLAVNWISFADTKETTLDSGINIGVRLLIFGIFSRGYFLIKESNP